MKLLRIVADGTITGTHIYDSDGRELTAELRVTNVTIVQEAGAPPLARIEITMPCEMDITVYQA